MLPGRRHLLINAEREMRMLDPGIANANTGGKVTHIILSIFVGLIALGTAFLLVIKLAMWMYAVDWDGKKSWDDADADTREDYMSNVPDATRSSTTPRSNPADPEVRSEATLPMAPEATPAQHPHPAEAEPSPRSTA